MGVSGSGKSTLAALLADSLGLSFLEADDFHSEANKARMRAGIPLSDDDREPWMNAVCKNLADMAARGDSCVLAHSALRRAHRDRLRRQGFRTLFLHLDGDRELIARRMAERSGHYMPARLLDSQFDDLEPTDDEPDVVPIDIAADAAEVTATASILVDEFNGGNHRQCN